MEKVCTISTEFPSVESLLLNIVDSYRVARTIIAAEITTRFSSMYLLSGDSPFSPFLPWLPRSPSGHASNLRQLIVPAILPVPRHS